MYILNKTGIKFKFSSSDDNYEIDINEMIEIDDNEMEYFQAPDGVCLNRAGHFSNGITLYCFAYLNKPLVKMDAESCDALLLNYQIATVEEPEISECVLDAQKIEECLDSETGMLHIAKEITDIDFDAVIERYSSYWIRLVEVDPDNQFFSDIDNSALTDKMGKLLLAVSMEEDYIVPEGINCIGSTAFFNNFVFRSVTIPEGVVSIEDGAFQGSYEDLEIVNLPQSLLSIGAAAFYGCEQLHSITIPQNIQYIGPKAFTGCNNLEKVFIPKNIIYEENDYGDYEPEIIFI